MRIKFGRCLPITNEWSTNRIFKNHDKSITGSSVKTLIAVHGLITQYIQNRPKVSNNDSNARAKTKNIFTVRNKAKNIFSVRNEAENNFTLRNEAEIIFANFVTYWEPRGNNFHVYLKGLSKNFYNKPR